MPYLVCLWLWLMCNSANNHFKGWIPQELLFVPSFIKAILLFWWRNSTLLACQFIDVIFSPICECGCVWRCVVVPSIMNKKIKKAWILSILLCLYISLHAMTSYVQFSQRFLFFFCTLNLIYMAVIWRKKTIHSIELCKNVH